MPERKQVSQESIDLAIRVHVRKLCQRLEEKGYGTFASKHEAYGVLMEEIHEVSEAVIADDPKQLLEELLDVGVATLFAVACIFEGSLDW